MEEYELFGTEIRWLF